MPIGFHTKLEVRTRIAGKSEPLAHQCATPREAREIAEKFSKLHDLPIFELSIDQKFRDAARDGIYLVSTCIGEMSVKDNR